MFSPLQEVDYDGWPPVEELPIKYMTEEHQKLLKRKCSKSKHVQMPIFPPAAATGAVDSDSPVKQSNNGMSYLTNTFTSPHPSGTSQTLDSKGSCTVTPSPAAASSGNPSKQAVEMHRKWIEAAEAMGGPGTRIVVSKAVAKKMILDLLNDAFAPMNITQIYKVRAGCASSMYISLVCICTNE
jgi:hypothetical protein